MTGIAAPYWFACSEAEREPDIYVLWHPTDVDCPGCDLKIEVQLRRFPDDPNVQRLAARHGVVIRE